jgi:hypothetical protein
MYIGLHVTYRLLLSDFNETWIFSTDFRKPKSQISNFMKIRPVWAQFHADGQTYIRDEANSRFSQLHECVSKGPHLSTHRENTQTQNTSSWFGEERGGGSPHYCDHMIRQEISQWGQARTRDPALGASQHGKAALCHRHWNQANVAAQWWHTVRLACWPPFLVSPARKFLCWRILNTFSPRIITLTAFHKTAPKNSVFPALNLFVLCWSQSDCTELGGRLVFVMETDRDSAVSWILLSTVGVPCLHQG